MSTVCKIVVPAAADDVADVSRNFLRRKGIEFSESTAEWPAAVTHENFQLDDSFPRTLSINQVTPAISELHFSSFARMEEFASHLSETLRVDVVVNVYQSVSTASYWALHASGQLVRAVEVGDGEVQAQTGAPLPFEGEPLGHDIGADDEPFYIFDDEDQDRYNEAVGIPVRVYQDYPPSWLNLVTPKPPEPVIPAKKKPWWRFGSA